MRQPKATDRAGFLELCLLEPKLLTLLASAREAGRGDASFCAVDAFYGHPPYPGFKPQIVQLVGWGAGVKPSPRQDDSVLIGDLVRAEMEAMANSKAPEPLRTNAAYSTVYEVIWASLPECRECSCDGNQDLSPEDGELD